MKSDNISEEDVKATEEEFENDPRSDEDHIGSAQRLAEEEGKIDLACNEYEQALLKTNDPVDLINIHHNIGHLIIFKICGEPKFIPTKDDLSDDELKKAEEHFNTALKIFKKLPLEKKQKWAELYDNLEDKRKLVLDLLMQKGDANTLSNEAQKHFKTGIAHFVKASSSQGNKKATEEVIMHLEEAITLGLPLKDEADALAFLGREYIRKGADSGEIDQLANGQPTAPLISKGIELLERALVLDTENNGKFLEDVKKMFMFSLSTVYTLISTTMPREDAISFLQEKLKFCDTSQVHYQLGGLYAEKNMVIQALLSYENAINAKTFELEGLVEFPERARYNIEVIKSDDVLVDEIKRERDELGSGIRRLDTERNKKFDEAGKIAYKECQKNKPDHPPAVVAKWNEIDDIDSRIAKNKQDLGGLKQREKKTGFLAKLGDSITSTAKTGKLKLDVHNLERKKDSVITEFGSVLYDSHKEGNSTLEELAAIWQEISDLERQIGKNEEEIASLRKYV
ncbi:MAG: hypothetical protein U9O90_00930 [Euryarchaeota archaeon]|nr:hypothetical protein [Euryarchaeota archaeon]